MRKATVSFCPDLTDPDAESLPLFHLTIEQGRLCVEFITTADELPLLIKDNFALGTVQMFPWWLTNFFEETGSSSFFQDLTVVLMHSNIYVSDISGNPADSKK